MKFSTVKIILIFVLLAQFLFTGAVLAASQKDIMAQVQAGGDEAGIATSKPAQTFVAELIQIVLASVGMVFIVLIFYGGYGLVTAQGNEEKAKQAGKTIQAAAIGLLIILMAYGITYFVASHFQEAAAGALKTQ